MIDILYWMIIFEGLSKSFKIVQYHTNYGNMGASLVTNQQFSELSSDQNNPRVYLMWVDILLQGLMNKNLHSDWIIQLGDQYRMLVGDTRDMMNGINMSTCMVWVPSVC